MEKTKLFIFRAMLKAWRNYSQFYHDIVPIRRPASWRFAKQLAKLRFYFWEWLADKSGADKLFERPERPEEKNQ